MSMFKLKAFAPGILYNTSYIIYTRVSLTFFVLCISSR